MNDKVDKKSAAIKWIKSVAVIVICIAGSFVLTLLALAGLESSNLMFALTQGKDLSGSITEKIEFRGTYRLIISVDGYETLDYACTEEVFQRYEVGDSVTLDLGIVVH